MKLWGEGAYEREILDGGETKYAQLFRAEAGDIIVNEIWARNGSVAVVPPWLDGSYGSNEFPMFTPKPDLLSPQWMHWFTRTRNFWQQCDEKSRGSSGKNRIRPEQFLSIEIPLPKFADQERILERLERLAARIDEAQELRKTAMDDAEALCRSIIAHDSPKMIPMRELVRLRVVTVKPEESYQFAGVYSFERGVFRSSRKTGMEFAYKRLTRVRTFRLSQIDGVGRGFGIAPAECDSCVVSTEFPVFEADQHRVLPEVLDTCFRTPSVWPKIAGISTGTNVRRRPLTLKIS